MKTLSSLKNYLQGVSLGSISEWAQDKQDLYTRFHDLDGSHLEQLEGGTNFNGMILDAQGDHTVKEKMRQRILLQDQMKDMYWDFKSNLWHSSFFLQQNAYDEALKQDLYRNADIFQKSLEQDKTKFEENDMQIIYESMIVELEAFKRKCYSGSLVVF